MLTIKLIHSSDPSESTVEERPFLGGRLTIGRSPECDWVLQDPSKAISKLHCEIYNRGDQVFIIDHSSNGTFLNGGSERLARGQPVPVNTGDRLAVSGYILAMQSSTPSLIEDDLFPEQPAQIPDDFAGSFPENLEQPPKIESGVTDRAPSASIDDLINDIGSPIAGDPLAPQPTREEPERGRGELSSAFQQPILSIQEFESSEGAIPADWSNPENESKDIIGGAGATGQNNQIPDDFDFDSDGGQEQPVPTDRAVLGGASVQANEALAAFVEGAGLKVEDFGGEDPLRVLSRAGQVYRQAVLNFSDILRDRSFLKNEFRLERTLLSSQDNNPLKFSDPQVAAVKLLKHPESGFVDGAEAVREAGQDIKRHQIAVLAGLREALQALLDRFRPSNILSWVATSTPSKRLIGGEGAQIRNAWNRFVALHENCEEDASTSANSFLNEAFRQGYEDQINKLD